MDDLVKRLRDGNASGRDKCKDMTDHFPCSEDCPCALELRVLADADRIEALEARVAAADALAEAVTHEREMVCQDFGMQQDAATAVHNALAAYQATKEGE